MKAKFLTMTLGTIMGVFFLACAQNANIKSVSPSEFQKLTVSKNTILVDVRTAEEVSEGKIANAINIDLYDPAFDEKISKLDKNKTILVYCRSGRRSMSAAEILAKKGYKVVNLEGGITEWQAQGLPVQK